MHEASIWSVGLFALLDSAIILLALLKKISLTLCQCLPIFRISQSFYSAWCLRCAEGRRYFALLRLSLGISAQLFSCDGQNGLKYCKVSVCRLYYGGLGPSRFLAPWRAHGVLENLPASWSPLHQC